MKAYFYCDPRSLNDATNYYYGVIERCLIECGYTFKTVFKLSEVKDANIIFTTTSKCFIEAKIRFPKTKTIYWAQGVSAEESKLGSKGFVNLLKYRVKRFMESIAINKSSLLFCVSERMVEYYRKEYHYKGDNVIVMPCYNLQRSNIFNIEQYKTPTFVYAGTASVWQSVDLMLDVYSLAEKEIPQAKLVICTTDKEVFTNKIEKKGIKSYEIKYVPLNQLQEELHKYKYGFIIREDNIVNNVATPTKMNSYLANYLIPIFSDAVDSFRRHIDLGAFTLMADCPLNPKTIAKQIVEFEKEDKDYSLYKSCVSKVFETYYNDSVYEIKIKSYIRKLLH